MSTEASTSTEPKWGRVVIAGGTDWPGLGKKASPAGKEQRPDLLSPHIVRSMSNVKVVSVHSSSASAHVVCIDVDGHAHMFGRNIPLCLGPSPSKDGFISEQTPKHVSPATFGADKSAKFVHAVTGKGTMFLIDSDGAVWAAGDNKLGQCGLSTATVEIKTFTEVTGPWKDKKIVSGSAGVNFSLLLTEDGEVYSFGSAEHGQLGHGRTGEHIVSAGKSGFEVSWTPKRVGGALTGKKIVQVSSGHSHSMALSDDGLVFVWGYNGYCRLGLGHQKDVLSPEVVPHFAQERIISRAKFITCGASDSTVIDNSGIYFIAGKFKTTGQGSGGSPYTTFKYFGDLMGLKTFKAANSSGAHFALCEEVDKECLDATLSVAFGQGTINGELGLGEDEPKSATLPTKIMPLAGLKTIDIAASMATTIFLISPNDKYADLPRHPEVDPEDEDPDPCVVCHEERTDKDGEVESALACDFCDRAYHIGCLSPPLESLPEDPEWFCSDCIHPSVPDANQGAGATGGGAKRKNDAGDAKGAKKQK